MPVYGSYILTMQYLRQYHTASKIWWCGNAKCRSAQDGRTRLTVSVGSRRLAKGLTTNGPSSASSCGLEFHAFNVNHHRPLHDVDQSYWGIRCVLLSLPVCCQSESASCWTLRRIRLWKRPHICPRQCLSLLCLENMRCLTAQKDTTPPGRAAHDVD